MDEATRQAILRIADLIQDKLEDENTDRQYVAEDALARLDMLADPTGVPRGGIVWGVST